MQAVSRELFPRKGRHCRSRRCGARRLHLCGADLRVDVLPEAEEATEQQHEEPADSHYLGAGHGFTPHSFIILSFSVRICRFVSCAVLLSQAFFSSDINKLGAWDGLGSGLYLSLLCYFSYLALSTRGNLRKQ